jgi:Outer membrane lipoprotein-sorting protein
MKRACLFLVIIILFVSSAAASAVAASPDVKTIVKAMKRGLQGPDGAVRIMNLKVISNGSTATEWKIVQANGDANDAHWILTAVLAPPGARGIAFLDKEETKAGGGEKLTGAEPRNGKTVYKLEDHPINNPYYSKVISYVATDSLLPVERDFYDHAGRTFKTERCTIETVDGVPTITKIVMNNVNSGGSSEIDVTKVIRNKPAPADIFDPKRLPEVLDHPFWKTVTQSP